MIRPSVYIFFPLALAFLVTHLMAMRLYLYWHTDWFDVIMHTWGGFLVIFGFLMLGTLGSGRLKFGVLTMAVFLLVIMVGWEVFEYVSGLTGTEADYVQDTIFDLICGAAGGALAYVLVKK